MTGNANLTFNNDNGIGFQIAIMSHVGTDYTSSSATDNAWVAYSLANTSDDYPQNWCNTASATWEITAVQLEVGSTATPFEHKLYGQELAACQRYFEKSYNQGVALGTNTNVGAYRPRHPTAGTNGSPISFVTSKRTTPTIVFYSRNTGATGKITNMSGGASDITCSTEGYAGEWNTVANYTSSGSETNCEGHWTADAEL